MKRLLIITWLLPTLCGCGGAQTGPAQGGAEPAFAIDDNVRTVAPDLAARVDRALSDAEAAKAQDDTEAAQAHMERARLWHVALTAEVERIHLDRARSQTAQETEAIETQRIADDTARAEIERHLRREQAAAIARAEAARVLLEAETDEARRRGGDSARITARREASRATVDRATAILAASIALGADERGVADARVAIDAARAQPDGSAKGMDAAQKAFARAHAALGQARQRRGAPDEHERASLLEALAAEGFTVELLDEGIVIWLANFFAGGALRPAAKGLLARLGAVLSAHPHGPLQVQALANATLSQALVRQRAERVKASLTAAMIPADGTRLLVTTSAQGSDHNNLVRVVLPAYGCSALKHGGATCIRDAATVTTSQ